MPSLSFLKGVDASYSVAGDRTTVSISSESSLKSRPILVGTGNYTFAHSHPPKGGSVWISGVGLSDSAAAQANETVGQDGLRRTEVDLAGIFPAAFVLGTDMTGCLSAPAVQVKVPWGKDIFVFLIKSPWFPLKFQLDRSLLSLEHDSSRAAAVFSVMGDGNLAAQVNLDGTGFKKVSLIMRRTVRTHSFDEPIGELEGGSQTFTWKPIVRQFDLLLVTGWHLPLPMLGQFARSLGAQVSTSRLNGWNLSETFVLCDGPAISYSLVLRGHRGPLENMEDHTDARFT